MVFDLSPSTIASQPSTLFKNVLLSNWATDDHSLNRSESRDVRIEGACNACALRRVRIVFKKNVSSIDDIWTVGVDLYGKSACVFTLWKKDDGDHYQYAYQSIGWIFWVAIHLCDCLTWLICRSTAISATAATAAAKIAWWVLDSFNLCCLTADTWSFGMLEKEKLLLSLLVVQLFVLFLFVYFLFLQQHQVSLAFCAFIRTQTMHPQGYGKWAQA